MDKLKYQFEAVNRCDSLMYYCYDCQAFTQNSESSDETNLDNKHLDIGCSICQSEFVEKVENSSIFTPGRIEPFNTSKLSQKSKQETNIPSASPSEENIQKTESRTVNKTIRLSYNNPFVRDVLIHAFPHVFRRANLERMQMIRSVLNSLNYLNEDEEKLIGPACKNYLNDLKRYNYKDYEQVDKFTNCPICTEVFDKEDTVISIGCGHTFHEGCLMPWLEVNNTCPNCRHMLPKKEV